MDKDKTLTTPTGVPIYNDTSSLSTKTPDITVLQDTQLLDKLAHFNRERIPERVVHAKGGGAFGYFEVTHDLSEYTCAKFLSNIGKKTKIFARFSTVGGEKGSADTARDPRGFAIKFYTEDGNYDIVGNNTRVFFIRDAMKFPDFIHTQKRNPITNLKDSNAVWDFFSLTPESMHQLTILFSDMGTPMNFRHMDGFGSHTFMWYNKEQDYVWIKYHFISRQGLKYYTNEEAEAIAGTNPDNSVNDLYANIQNGNFPKWDLFVQIIPKEEAKTYRYDIFDVTKRVYEKDYPLIPVGTMTLNELPENFFSDVEQVAFSPGNFVYGIGPSPDKMLNGRLFAYPDAQRHRIGPNFMQIHVNSAQGTQVNNYERDGQMSQNKAGFPNYSPNSFGGPVVDKNAVPPNLKVAGQIDRHDFVFSPIDLEQADILYSEEFNDKERTNLIHNISLNLSNAQIRIQYRQTALFYLTNNDYGTRVAKSLNLDLNKVIWLANLTQEERVEKTANDKEFEK